MTEFSNSKNFKKVEETLREIYSDKEYIQILNILVEDAEKAGSREKSTEWEMMAEVADKPKLLKHYADQLLKQHSSINSSTMSLGRYLITQIKEFLKNFDPRAIGNWLIEDLRIVPLLSLGLSEFWVRIPETIRRSILQQLETQASRLPTVYPHNILCWTSDTIKSLGSKFPAYIAAGAWAWMVTQNLKAWYNGDQTKSTTFKNIIVSTVVVFSSYQGSIEGAALGAYFGPIGILLGAVLGSTIAGYTGNKVAEYGIDIIIKFADFIKSLISLVGNTINTMIEAKRFCNFIEGIEQLLPMSNPEI